MLCYKLNPSKYLAVFMVTSSELKEKTNSVKKKNKCNLHSHKSTCEIGRFEENSRACPRIQQTQMEHISNGKHINQSGHRQTVQYGQHL